MLLDASLDLTFGIPQSAKRGANLGTCMRQGLTANLQTRQMALILWLVRKFDTVRFDQPFTVTRHRSNIQVL